MNGEEECCVCYTDYNKEHFSINCNHSVCNDCFSNIKNKSCPLCRCHMTVKYKKRVYTKRIKGKLNLKKFDKIKTHLQYKYTLEGRANNYRRDNKNLYHMSLMLIYNMIMGDNDTIRIENELLEKGILIDLNYDNI